jgi:mannose-6-phosphate isomerase-like protein (cupin superfamily)
MAITVGESIDLERRFEAHIGRFTAKTPDWDAFPSNRGFPELERAQVRYVGAGGSPKVDDRNTLPPGHFTLSLVYQPTGKYAAIHSHEVEEAFLVLRGVLTVAWEFDGDPVEVQLGPKDMILNPFNRPHGFRNDGLEPVLMSIMVGSSRPHRPLYKNHPRDIGVEAAERFMRELRNAPRLDPATGLGSHREMSRYVVRYSGQRPEWHDAGFARLNYIGGRGAPAGNYRKDLVHLPPGRGVRRYGRSIEDVYLVLEGCLTVGWEDGRRRVESRLGPRDVVFNPAGQPHDFRNDGFEDVQFMMITGGSTSEEIRFEARS